MSVGGGPILLATRSAGKLRELRPMFADVGLTVVDLDAAGVPETPEEDALEQFATFEENALAKARYFFQRTRIATVADDSGLEVAALGGRPGVRSKRWSGRDDLDGVDLDHANNQTLLAALETTEERRARYVCAAVYAGPNREVVRVATTDGCILREPRGSAGFGYDPYFLSDELGQTFGEASRFDKERVSHRGRAFRLLLTSLLG